MSRIRVRASGLPRLRPQVRVRARVTAKVRVRRGLLPTTLHSVFYGRVGPVA